ncbi:glycosyltransferase, partial [Vibrio ponticus]
DFDIPDSISIYIDQHDIISHTMGEGAKGSSGIHRRFIYKIEEIRWKKFERKFYKRVDREGTKILSVKDEDKNETLGLVNLSKVYMVPNGHSVNRKNLSSYITKAWQPQILFIGTSHERNVNALKTFYEYVLPLIHKQLPNIKTKIVGAFETSDLAFIKAKEKNISIYTYVDDISNYYNYGDIQVLPFNMGAGSKLKVFESFAYGVPVVGTKLAFTGVPIFPIEDLVCSNSYEDIARYVVSLVNDRLSYDLVRDKMITISRDFDWEVILDEVEWL